MFHEHAVHCTDEWFDARQVAKIALYTAFICNVCFQFTHIFLSQKNIYALFGHKKNLRTLFFLRTRFTFFSRKRLTHCVRKVFARWKLPSGKFRLFGPLPPPSSSCHPPRQPGPGLRSGETGVLSLASEIWQCKKTHDVNLWGLQGILNKGKENKRQQS